MSKQITLEFFIIKQINITAFKAIILLMITFGTIEQASAQSADSIISNYVKARGGYKKLKAIENPRLTGVYEEGKFKSGTYIEWKRPFFRVVVIGVPDEVYREGFNGQAWEYSAPDESLKFTVGAAEAAGRRGAEFDESIIDYRLKGHSVEFVGREKLGDSDVYHLKVNLNDGWVKNYYFDAKSYLIVALRKAMPLHAVGQDIESLTTYENYKLVSGVLYPHLFVERNTKTGPIMNTLQWERIEANVTIDDRRFYPPTGSFKREASQKK